jgi:mono/diheme cytochrome c family protein
MISRVVPEDIAADDLDVSVSGNHARYRSTDDSGTAIYEDGHWVFDGGAPVRAQSSPSITTITMRTPDRIVQQGGKTLAAYNAGKQVATQAGCLACHKIANDGNDGPGAELTHIGSLRTRQAIVRALIDPAAPMPSFREFRRADPEKFNNLVEFLAQLK